MKCCVKRKPVLRLERFPPPASLVPRTYRLAGQRLTYSLVGSDFVPLNLLVHHVGVQKLWVRLIRCTNNCSWYDFTTTDLTRHQIRFLVKRFLVLITPLGTLSTHTLSFLPYSTSAYVKVAICGKYKNQNKNLRYLLSFLFLLFSTVYNAK